MQTVETKTSSTASNQIQKKQQPFFNKGGEGSFFSKSNEATQSFFSPSIVQAKLTIGQPNDKYEVEADTMADKVVQRLSQPENNSISSTSSGTVQRQCSECEEELQKKEEEEHSDNELSLQRKSMDMPSDNPPNLESRLNSSKGGGNSLPSDLQTSMGSEFGADFSTVRIHTDTEAVQMSQDIGAQAFTHGSDIYFNQGKYDTNSNSGKHLLAHELAHTVQQNGNEFIQRETITEESTPSQAEASLDSHPSRPRHEIVLMSGGPVSNREDPDHDNNPLNFATAARIKIERLMESAFGNQRIMIPDDKITWVIMRPPYRYRALEDGEHIDSYINLFQSVSLVRLRRQWDNLARQSGLEHVASSSEAIKIHFVDSSDDFVEFMNNGAVEGDRATMPIGRFEYFGHGVPGALWFTMGWDHLRSVDRQFFGVDDIERLDSAVFLSYSEYRSWSCNTATPYGSQPVNFVETWVETLGGRFVAPVGRSSYEFILDQPRNQDAVVLSEGLYPRDAADRRNAPTIDIPRPAYWTTTTRISSESSLNPEDAVTTTDENWVHDSELPGQDNLEVESSTSNASETPLNLDAESLQFPPSPDDNVTEDSGNMVCQAEVVPFNEDGIRGSEICSEHGSGQLNINYCEPEEQNVAIESSAITDDEMSTAIESGFYPVQFVDLTPESVVAIDEHDESWQPLLREIAERAYNETLDTDSIPTTLQQTYSLASNIRAQGRGFRIGVVERNGRIYYKIFGSRGANPNVPGRWYAARNLPRTNSTLNTMLQPRAGLVSGLRSGSIGIGGALTVAGTTLDYAIDPNKDVASSDFAVDLSLDLVKSTGATAAGAAAGAAATSWLAAGTLGATVGSAAPVVGTIIGFAVGVLAAMAIEFFIGDFRASVKAWLRNRHNIRNTRRSNSLGNGSSDEIK
ncbi:DUF4157 domain-containing protein [uncultured Psychroserpens sp.]|uniref:eCIS core domain-containing protein n=1 Tax=uncultured Psychroserpens sp. TaxID=255436 RepID=UPI0026194ECB|nr:DUF4157 domain-containing protein [uncultured Psychroserpens sp.]